LLKGRLCALRKSKEAIEKANKQLRRIDSKKGCKLQPATLEHAEYITLFTTVMCHTLKGVKILSLYRGRWQVELVFKRLKGIVGIGHLPKYNPESCIAWLYGKMVVALLVERLYQEAEFFPWGYPLWDPEGKKEPKKSCVVRSPWREFEFWFMVVQHAIIPRLSINEILDHWPQIKARLMQAFCA